MTTTMWTHIGLLALVAIFDANAQDDYENSDMQILGPRASMSQMNGPFDDGRMQRRRPDTCGPWSDWKQVKCWWPDQQFDSLPKECTNVSLPSRVPDYVKKFVEAKTKEVYNMIQQEYKTRGAPAKCGFCSHSFECRSRNRTDSDDSRKMCRTKEVRPIDASCDDSKACTVSQVSGGCPSPLFLNKERLRKINQLIQDGDHEGALRAIDSLQRADQAPSGMSFGQRPKRQAWDSQFGGPSDFYGMQDNSFQGMGPWRSPDMWTGASRSRDPFRQSGQQGRNDDWARPSDENSRYSGRDFAAGSSEPWRGNSVYGPQNGPYQDNRQRDWTPRQSFYDSYDQRRQGYQQDQFRPRGQDQYDDRRRPDDRDSDQQRPFRPRWQNDDRRGPDEEAPRSRPGDMDWDRMGYSDEDRRKDRDERPRRPPPPPPPPRRERPQQIDGPDRTDGGRRRFDGGSASHQGSGEWDRRPDPRRERFGPRGDFDEMRPQRRPDGDKGERPPMDVLARLLHGTACVSTGSECLCCCAGYIPDLSTGNCRSVHDVIPDVQQLFDTVTMDTANTTPAATSRPRLNTARVFTTDTPAV